jgi:hypothetical protein
MATPSTGPVQSQNCSSMLGRLDTEWARLVRSPAARQALRRWAVDDALARAESLDEILRRRRDPDRSGAVMTALASRAAHDDVAARTLLQAMLPGLVRMGADTARRLGPGAEVMSDVCACAWMVIRSYPTHRPSSVATNIVMDTRYALLRLHSVRETPHALDRTGGGGVADSAEADAFSTVLAADIVDAACARGVISRRAADVVIETRLGDRPMCQLLGRVPGSQTTLWRLRERAELDLRNDLALAG